MNLLIRLFQKDPRIVYPFIFGMKNLGLVVAGSTYMLFLLENGLNKFEANLVNASCWTALFILEVPTGVIADVFGRMTSTVLGYFFHIISLLVYFLLEVFGDSLERK